VNEFPGWEKKQQGSGLLDSGDPPDRVVFSQLGLWGLTDGGELVILDKLVSVSALVEGEDARVSEALKGVKDPNPHSGLEGWL